MSWVHGASRWFRPRSFETRSTKAAVSKTFRHSQSNGDGFEVRFEPIPLEDRRGPLPEKTERVLPELTPVAPQPAEMLLDDPSVDPLLPRPRRRWWLRGLMLVLLIGLGVLLAMLPDLVAEYPWSRNQAISLALPANEGSVSSERARFGWLEPPVVWNLAISDDQGQPVLKVGQVRFRRDLWRLVAQRGHYGPVQVWTPEVRFRLQGDRLLGPEWLPRGERAPQELALTLEDGRFELLAEDGQTPLLNLRDISGRVLLHDDPDQDSPWELAARVGADLELAADGRVETGREIVALHLLEAKPADGGWGVSLTGQLSGRGTRHLLELQGELHGDLAQLSPRLDAWLPIEVRAEGRQVSQFRVSGRLGELAQLPPGAGWHTAVGLFEGEATPAWDRLTLGGLALGRGLAHIKLANGMLDVAAVEIPCHSGWAHLRASVDLRGEQPALMLPAGPLLEDVRVTPAMCQTWLKYLAPIVANATQVEGRLSLDLAAGRLPLDVLDPEAIAHGGDLGGRLRLDSVEVGVAPLPALLAKTFGLPHSVRLVDGADVEFRMHNGQLYHRGFAFRLGPLQVQSEGNVGWDQSIDLVADVHIPADTELPGRMLPGLRGRTMRVPIHGTLSDPKIDLGRLTAMNTSAALGRADDESAALWRLGAHFLLGDDQQPGLVEILRRLRKDD